MHYEYSHPTLTTVKKGGNKMNVKYSKLCESNYQKMQGFMEVCLLLLLYKEPGHGYGLIEQLSFFGFIEENFNVSSLYRTLRKMEKDGLVISSWLEGSQGPKKRVYNITDVGKQELETWVVILKLRKERINKLINRYEQIIKQTL